MLKQRRGYKQQQISDATGVPPGTVGRYFAGIDDESANYETVRKLVDYMGGNLDEAAGTAAPEPESVESERRQIDALKKTIAELNVKIASLSAMLEARDESTARNGKRYEHLERELNAERKHNRHLQAVLVAMIVALIALACVYIWDASNLHKGLTALLNQ